MNIVRVKIDQENEKPKWLEVPNAGKGCIQVGDQLCCSVKGRHVTGVATTNVMSGDGIEELLSQSPAHFADLKVTGKLCYLPVKSLKIPIIYEQSRPDVHKITERINELYTTGKFNTYVAVDGRFNLLDGYTAFLVARMFNHESILAYWMFR